MKKYSFIKQTDIKDCGVACLSMIVKNYGGFVNHEKLCDMTHTTRNGTNAYNLVQALKKLGFNSYGINYIINKDADKIILPAIAHTVIDNIYHHFVVIYEINYKKETLLIADPANKIYKITFTDFNKIYTNKLLIAYPVRPIIKEQEISIKSYILKILKSQKILSLLFISTFYFASSLFYLFLIKVLLKGNIKFNLIFLLLLSMILKYIFNNYRYKRMIDIESKTNECIMNESFLDILNLPYLYYRNRTTGEIISILNDIGVIKNLIEIILILFMDIILTLLCGILLFISNKLLFSAVLLILIFYLINHLYYKRKIYQSIDNYKQQNSLLNSYMTESIEGFESIKGQNFENVFKDRFKTKCMSYIDSLKKYQLFQNKFKNLNELITDISMFIILLLGVFLINKGTIDFSDLIIFYYLMNYFLNPIKSLTELTVIFDEIKVSLNRLLNLKYANNNVGYIPPKDKIKIRNLKYEIDENKIINSLNIDIKLGEKIMMIGHSGCGKSTLLKLLKQYYRTNQIMIGKKNINKVNLKDRITYISQNEYLFTDTLYNNITMFKKVDKTYIDKIIKICELDNLISKNNLGINMLIEENGFNLSGGEKQRIILARALINIKDYLFIDEGLSEVDISLERSIIKNIIKEFKDKTIIFVSHRNDNLDLFDKLIILDKGEILEKNGRRKQKCLETLYGW